MSTTRLRPARCLVLCSALLALAATARAQTVESRSSLVPLSKLGGPPVRAEQGDLVYDVGMDRYVLAVGRAVPGSSTVRLREIPVAGTSLPAEVKVGNGLLPALAVDHASGGFVLAFGAEQRLFARALDPAFQTLRTDELFTGLAKGIHIAENRAAGEFLVAASRSASSSTLVPGIEARRFSASTGALAPPVVVATELPQPFRMTFDPFAGEYLLARLQIPGTIGLFPENYRVARVSDAGVLGAPVLFGPQDPGSNRITVVHDPRRRRNLAVFTELDSAGVGHLWGQWFGGDGTLLGSSFEFFQPQGTVLGMDVAAVYSPLSDAFVIVLEKFQANGSQRLVTFLLRPDGTIGPTRSTLLTSTVIEDLRIALRPADDTLLVTLPGSGELVGMRFAVVGSAPQLSRVGCGTARPALQASGLTPGGSIALIWSTRLGTYALPPSICSGLILQLESPRLGKLVTADATGAISVPLPASACALPIQAVDIEACRATNVVN